LYASAENKYQRIFQLSLSNTSEYILNSSLPKAALKWVWRSLIVASLVLTLSACSVFGIRSAEEASYIVLDNQGDFQLREYAGFVVAQTIINAEFDEAGSQAFKRLFGYISGENEGSRKIAMTAPVMAREDDRVKGESIAMTAPVIVDQNAEGWRFAFVLPASYNLDSAPLPTNPSVILFEIKPQRVATLRFSGLLNEHDFRDNATRLRTWMSINNLKPASSARVAGFDPPWALPFMRRNEVMIDVSS
jgi:hypothetical protein